MMPWRMTMELRLIPVEPRQSPVHFKRIATICDDCTSLFPSVQSCIRIIQKIIWNNRYYIEWKLCIVVIFARFQSTGVIYQGSAGIFLGSDRALPRSTGALPVSTGDLPGSTRALPASPGNDRGSTGMKRSFIWVLPGWSGAHPGWLVGNYRSAAGVSVITTIISQRIVPHDPSNLPGRSWALPGVSETAA
jgi:hypothetical protein